MRRTCTIIITALAPNRVKLAKYLMAGAKFGWFDSVAII
jgi:hypothetical protein